MVVEKYMEVKMPSKDQDIPMVHAKKKNPDLGYITSQVLRWAREMPTMQIGRGINKPPLYFLCSLFKDLVGASMPAKYKGTVGISPVGRSLEKMVAKSSGG